MSIVVSTADRRFTQMVVFFHADESPIFRDFSGLPLCFSCTYQVYDWVFLLAVSSQPEAFGFLLGVNGVQYDWNGKKAAPAICSIGLSQLYVFAAIFGESV